MSRVAGAKRKQLASPARFLRGVALYTYVTIKKPRIERRETQLERGAFIFTTENGNPARTREKSGMISIKKRLAEEAYLQTIGSSLKHWQKLTSLVHSIRNKTGTFYTTINKSSIHHYYIPISLFLIYYSNFNLFKPSHSLILFPFARGSSRPPSLYLSYYG